MATCVVFVHWFLVFRWWFELVFFLYASSHEFEEGYVSFFFYARYTGEILKLRFPYLGNADVDLYVGSLGTWHLVIS